MRNSTCLYILDYIAQENLYVDLQQYWMFAVYITLSFSSDKTWTIAHTSKRMHKSKRILWKHEVSHHWPLLLTNMV